MKDRDKIHQMWIVRSLLTRLNEDFNNMEYHIMNDGIIRTGIIDDFNDSCRQYIQALDKVLKSDFDVPEPKRTDRCVEYTWGDNHRVDYIDFTGLPTNNESVEEILDSIFPESDGSYRWVSVPNDKIVLNALFMLYHTM